MWYSIDYCVSNNYDAWYVFIFLRIFMPRRLSIVSGSSTALNVDWEEVSTFSGWESLISAEEILWDNEETLIKSIDKSLKKARKSEQKIKMEKFVEDLAATIWSSVSDPDFEKHFHAVYSQKYPDLFENWIFKSELFDEEHLGLVTSKKSTKSQIRDIFQSKLQ